MNQKKNTLLWIGTGIFALGFLFAKVVFPEYLWLSIALAVLLVACLAGLIMENRKAMRKRTVAFGTEALVVTLLGIAIVGVLNFLASKYSKKWDLTQDKIHTLSDQTEKLVKGLKNPIKATFFSKVGQRDKVGVLLENLKSLSSQFEVEYVDPDKEPVRAKQAGIKKYETLQLTYTLSEKAAESSGQPQVRTKEQKIEDVNEEKLTNALIKLLKDSSQTLCAITGHGEKSFSSTEAEGYDTIKKLLADESYEVKEVSLVEQNKIPSDCAVIAIVGPTRSFFEPEVKILKDYLIDGGRALIALDINVKGAENSPEMIALLKDWYVQVKPALIVDPVSRMLGVDASVPIIASFNKDHPISRDIQENAYFAFSRPLEIIKGAPAETKLHWLTQTTPKSWAESNLQELSSGKVQFNAGADQNGPLTTGIVVEAKKTRLVVFGSSLFASNNYSRFGSNVDVFMNSINWLMEDENQISIRAKESGPGKIELSNKAANTIFLVTVIVIPLLVAVAGIVIWAIRRRL